MTELFRGATVVRQGVIDYLTVTVPAIIDEARIAWNLDANLLPYPVKYDGYEPFSLDEWPLLGVSVAEVNDFDPVDINEDGGFTAMPAYNVRVYTWVRTPSNDAGDPVSEAYAASIRCRDDIAACVRAAILKTGHFGQPAFMFQKKTFTESHAETQAVTGPRYVSAVLHSFTLKVDESVPLVVLGSADTITVLAELMEVGS